MSALVNQSTRMVKWRDVDGSWPPETSGSSVPAFKISGVVGERPGKVEVRLDKQKGYLKGKKSSDLLRQYVSVSLRIGSVAVMPKGSSSMETAPSTIDALRNALGSFASYMQYESDRTHFLGSGSTLRFWCSKQSMGDIAADYNNDAKGSLIADDAVTVVTQGSTLVLKRISVTEAAVRDQSKRSMLGETNFYGRTAAVNVDTGGSGEGFADKIFSAKATIVSKEAVDEDPDVDDDEWD